MGVASLPLSATEQEGEGKVYPSHLMILNRMGEEEVGPLSLNATEQEKGRGSSL